MKKIIALALILSFLLTGCSNAVNERDEKGNQIYYTKEQLSLNSTNGYEGIFIKNNDDTYSPLITMFEAYAGTPKQASPERYLWFTENSGDVLKLIPKVSDNQLVLVYNKDKSMPSDFYLERYDYKGYTVGCHFYRAENDEMILQTKDALEGTYMGTSISQVDDENEYVVSEVNESQSLPLDNIDNNMGLLLGLENNKYYKFSFFKGTKYISITTLADTQVFQSASVIQLNNAYEKTKNGYFVINLPDNLEQGYYYICGKGMFYYEKTK